MMFVDFKIAVDLDVHIHRAMVGKLFEHVVEKLQSGVDMAEPRTVQPETDADICFACLPVNLRRSLSANDTAGNVRPRHPVTKNQRHTAQVTSQLSVCLTIAYHITVNHIILTLHVVGEHRRTGLASRRIVFGEVTVDMDRIKSDAFTRKCVKNEPVNRPKGIFGKSGCTKAVLVAHHDKLVVRQLAYTTQTVEHAGHK